MFIAVLFDGSVYVCLESVWAHRPDVGGGGRVSDVDDFTLCLNGGSVVHRVVHASGRPLLAAIVTYDCTRILCDGASVDFMSLTIFMVVLLASIASFAVALVALAILTFSCTLETVCRAILP